MTIQLEPTKLSDWVSISVAALAFAATWWQAKIARQHNKISVTPMLVSSNNWEWTNEALIYSFVVQNVGAGVALVKDRHFTYEGAKFKPPQSDRLIEELCAVCFKQVIPYRVVATSLFGERAKIPPGSSIAIAKLSFANPHPALQDVVQGLASKIDFHVTYESLYGERFHFSTRD